MLMGGRRGGSSSRGAKDANVLDDASLSERRVFLGHVAGMNLFLGHVIKMKDMEHSSSRVETDGTRIGSGGGVGGGGGGGTGSGVGGGRSSRRHCGVNCELEVSIVR